ncbi:MAG: NAD(P)-dependent oxidoreductase [Saprospiraceae bacterium]|nr:NAD(P)-dependent oxidoreductase [Saprospiraceae bacterium]MCZ2338317.1 NAD(P)-dependent oxidoreductase [Chitinophagales bacterium]
MQQAVILITGANGFIGHHIVQEAIRQNMVVYAGVRAGSNTQLLDGLSCQIIPLKYNDVASMSATLQQIQPDYIIHNAGLTRTPDYNQYLEVNKQYLVNLVEAIRQSHISLKKLLFVSSLAAFGPADFQKSGIITHDATHHPVTDYGRSKLAAEEWLWKQQDLPFNVIRPTAVYGPGEKDLLNVFKMIKKGINVVAGFGNQQLTFIYVDDLVKLMIKATTTSHMHRAYFGADGQLYDGRAFPEAIATAMNKKYITIRLPIFIIKMAASMSELAGKILGYFPTLYRQRVNEISARNWNCDTSNLETDLGFKPAFTLQAGVHETVRWYEEHQWI